MGDVAHEPTRRRGRPPATDSADTRRAILDNARRLFAERGYGAITNKDVAEAAGITTGALYHYVDSKLDLYVAVHRDVQRRVYGRFIEAVETPATFLGQLDAVLEAAHELNLEDPTLALFVGTVRTDMRRFPEVADRLERSVVARDEFFMRMVGAGVASGEIRPEGPRPRRGVRAHRPHRPHRGLRVARTASSGDRLDPGAAARRTDRPRGCVEEARGNGGMPVDEDSRHMERVRSRSPAGHVFEVQWRAEGE